MRIVALSDTHGWHRKVVVPAGDMVIFAGDAMTSGYSFKELKDFAEWFSDLPHQYKIMVGGNHDRVLESSQRICLSYFKDNVIYLKDSGAEVAGKLFWGSPYQPEFCDWAFNVQRGEEIKKHWDLIHPNTDVLITHGPPYGILDKLTPSGGKYYGSYQPLGCEELKKAVQDINPLYHIFGHIHAGYGMDIDHTVPSRTIFRNVSICNEEYVPVNTPHVFDL